MCTGHPVQGPESEVQAIPVPSEEDQANWEQVVCLVQTHARARDERIAAGGKGKNSKTSLARKLAESIFGPPHDGDPLPTDAAAVCFLQHWPGNKLSV